MSWLEQATFPNWIVDLGITKSECKREMSSKLPLRLYEFKVMPFRLTNAPATFQAAMNTIFAPLLRRCVLVFMDNILIYSKSLTEHLSHLQEVFQILDSNIFLLKRPKCVFAK
jgi:hypothetical protein